MLVTVLLWDWFGPELALATVIVAVTLLWPAIESGHVSEMFSVTFAEAEKAAIRLSASVTYTIEVWNAETMLFWYYRGARG